MNKIDALRCELKCREMVEGTGLEWWECVKFLGREWNYNETPDFSENENNYEFALGVVEGKPVWKGDALYWIANGKRHLIDRGYINLSNGWSWNPPKPKTIMVEHRIDDVVAMASMLITSFGPLARMIKECETALENAKCK